MWHPIVVQSVSLVTETHVEGAIRDNIWVLLSSGVGKLSCWLQQALVQALPVL